MRILCDVYDAAGNRLGEGPITTLQAVSVQRILDGAGTFNFITPATDARAVELLTVRRRVRLFIETFDTVREIGRGIILTRKYNEAASGATFTFTCADNLEELKYANTLIGRAYQQQSVTSVVTNLMGLVSGWSTTVSPGAGALLLEARFDGVSVLKALQQIAKNLGIHFRLGDTGNALEVGTFGNLGTIAAMNIETTNTELYANANVAVIDRIEAGDYAENIVNTIIPLGAGEGAASLKLKRSTRTSPYTIIEAVGPNGKKYWYLEDTASIAAYGRVWGVAQFKDIAPVRNGRQAKIDAANQLYDAAATALQRSSVVQKAYKLTLRNVKANLKPGDKINVRYKGSVTRGGTVVDYVDINEDFWILKVTENIGLEGQTVALEVSNVDMTSTSTEEAIVEMMEAVKLRGLKPGTGVNCRSFVYAREVAPTFPAIVPVEITDATLELIRLRVRIKTTPFRATSKGAAHRHLVASLGQTGQVPSGHASYIFATNESGTQDTTILPHDGTPPVFLYTQGAASGADFGIQDDTQYPTGISIYVNGVDRTGVLGGPFAPSGGAIDVVLDTATLTDLIEQETTFAQVHEIELRCSTGRGRIEATVEIYETTQDIEPDGTADTDPGPGGGGSSTGGYTLVEDEGVALAQRNVINFTGLGVTVTDSGGKTVVTIPGGGGGGSGGILGLDEGGSGADLSAADDGAVRKQGSAFATRKGAYNQANAPTTSNDSSQGYLPFSEWVRTIGDTYILWNAANGQWIKVGDPLPGWVGGLGVNLLTLPPGKLYRNNGGTVSARKDNQTTTDPTPLNDVTEGYEPGSTWLNTTDGRYWIFVSGGVGAAVWLPLHSTSGGIDLLNVTSDIRPNTGSALSIGSDTKTWWKGFFDGLYLKEVTAPSFQSGFGILYAKSDGKVYYRNDADQEFDLTDNGGSSAYNTVMDESTTLTQRQTMRFIGGGVTATDDAANGRTNVTIPEAANPQLSNLSGTTSVPVDILPSSSGVRNFGSAAARWNFGYFTRMVFPVASSFGLGEFGKDNQGGEVLAWRNATGQFGWMPLVLYSQHVATSKTDANTSLASIISTSSARGTNIQIAGGTLSDDAQMLVFTIAGSLNALASSSGRVEFVFSQGGVVRATFEIAIADAQDRSYVFQAYCRRAGSTAGYWGGAVAATHMSVVTTFTSTTTMTNWGSTSDWDIEARFTTSVGGRTFRFSHVLVELK